MSRWEKKRKYKTKYIFTNWKNKSNIYIKKHHKLNRKR